MKHAALRMLDFKAKKIVLILLIYLTPVLLALYI